MLIASHICRMLSGFGFIAYGMYGKLLSNIDLTNPATTSIIEVYKAIKPYPPIIF
jgi:hypothetical protein